MKTLSLLALIAATATPALAEYNPERIITGGANTKQSIDFDVEGQDVLAMTWIDWQGPKTMDNDPR